MSEGTGISVDRRRLLRTMQPLAFTATQALERARHEYPFRRPVQSQFQARAVTRAAHVAVLQQMKTMIGLHAVVEQASRSTPTKTRRLPLQAFDPAAVGLAPRRTPQQRSNPPALPTARPPLHPPTESPAPAPLDPVLCLAIHVPQPGAATIALLLPLTALKEIRLGWQPCTSLILAFHLTNKCYPRSLGKCSKNSGKKKAGLPTHMTATLHPWPCIHLMHHLFLPSGRTLILNSSLTTLESARTCHPHHPRVPSYHVHPQAQDIAPCLGCRTQRQHLISTRIGPRLLLPQLKNQRKQKRRKTRAVDAVS